MVASSQFTWILLILVSFCSCKAKATATIPNHLALDSATTPTTFNWSASNIDSNGSAFYNGPYCALPNNSLGWNALKNPDGTFYTANKRPIVILYDGWNSSLLNAYLGQYMLEAMGYRVQVVARIDYVLGPEFYSNAVDLEFEILPDEFGSSFNQLTQVDRVAVSLGPLGYNKGVGLYIPKYVLDKNPTWSLDFWRFLLNPSYRSIFPAPGSTPRALVNGGLVCNGMPGLCMNGTYTPKQCQQANSTCIELWHIDPTFSPAIYQRLIDGLQLPVVIKFLGSKDTAKSTCQAAINQKKTVFFYYWTPTLFVAKNQLTNVLFPRSNSTEYAAFTNDNRNVLTSEPQSGILQKLASSRFVNDFPELLSLFTKYQLPDNQINYMLKTAGAGIPSQAVCQWFRANQALWMDWIPPVPKSVVSCPLGMGRYLVGIVFTCVTCPKGTYNWISNSTTECTSCPENFDCPGGSEVHVLEGMWMALPTTVTPVSYICPHQEACCTNNSCPALTCAPQFTGKLCTECLDKSMYLWGGNCYSCNSGGGTSLYLVIFGALLCTLALLALPYEEAPTVELLFFYFQVSRYIFEGQVNGILKVPGISTFLSITALHVDGFVSDCVLPISGISKHVFRFFLPSLIIGYIIAIYFGLRTLQAYYPRGNEFLMRYLPHHLRGDSVSLICFRAIIIVMTFVIMPLVDGSLSLLQCSTIEGQYVLSQVPDVKCFGSKHAPSAALAIIIIIVMLGILPAVIGYMLYWLKKHDMIRYEDEGLSPIQKLFQCLYIIFKPEMFYMMPITIVEKGLVSILFSIMASSSRLVQTNIYIIALAALCGTRIYWQPFSNHLEAYLNREVALGILTMIALRQYTDTFGVTTVSLIEIGIALFLPPTLHILRWTRENYHKHKDIIHSTIRQISSAGSQSSKRDNSVFAKSQTESCVKQSGTQSQTVSSRSRIASGLKGSIGKLNISSRTALRSTASSRKPSTDENTPLNPDEVHYSIPST